MRDLRIALMPSAYAPCVGGVEVLTARLAHHLQARGHTVEIWAPRSAGDELPERETIDGLELRRFVFAMPRADLGTVLQIPLAAARTLLRLRSAVREFRPSHLHVQCFSGNGAYATALSTLAGVPLVVSLQGETVMDDHDIYDRSRTLRGALRLGLRRAQWVTGCSQFTLNDSIARFGLRPDKTSVIFNGVDLDEVACAPVGFPFERYVLALGRVVHKKGFDLLIDAFARIADDHRDVGLVVGGSGVELAALQSQAQRIGLVDRVHFPGRLDRGQVAAAMAGAEAFVMPSRVEPFGIVALEGWRAGVPVIVSSRGGAPEFVKHELTGMVADPQDPADLAGCLRAVLSDRHLHERIGSGGRLDLPSFEWRSLVERYEEVYARASGRSLVSTG